MPEFWRKRLSRLRERFDQLASQPPLQIQLFETPKAKAPNAVFADGVNTGALGWSTLYGDWWRDRIRTVLIPHGPSRDAFMTLASEAGQVITAAEKTLCPTVIAKASMDALLPHDHRWMYALFEVCWHGAADGLPRADRLVDYSFVERGETIRVAISIESIEVMRDSNSGPTWLTQIPDPPDCFRAELGNAAETSVAVIDWLLDMPTSGESPDSRAAELRERADVLRRVHEQCCGITNANAEGVAALVLRESVKLGAFAGGEYVELRHRIKLPQRPPDDMTIDRAVGWLLSKGKLPEWISNRSDQWLPDALLVVADLIDAEAVMIEQAAPATIEPAGKANGKPASAEDDPALVALTPNEQAIFDALTDAPMTGADVLAKLAREGISNVDESALSRACKRPPMKARGVRHRKGAGYYKIPV